MSTGATPTGANCVAPGSKPGRAASRGTAPDRPVEGSIDRSRRRLLLAAGALLGTGALAGCRAVSRYEFRADPVVWPGADRQTLGYRQRLREPVVTEHVDTAEGVRMEATIRSRVAVYGPAGGRPLTASAPTVGVASTPPAVVSGEPLNPLAGLDTAALLEDPRGRAFLSRAGLDRAGHRRRSPSWVRSPMRLAGRVGDCLGRPVRVESYGGLLAGEPRSAAFVHLARVTADSVVLCAAVHGRDVPAPAAASSLVGPNGSLDASAFAAAAKLAVRAVGALRYER